MLYNKNNVRKTNDKKILHKVGKQWKVISVALLMAIGGGAAVATHANAQTTNGATNAEVAALDQKPSVQGPQSANPSSAASSSASAKPASAVSYLPGDNGSAASYHAKAENDASNMNANKKIVNNYVNSLNAKFPSVTSSLAGKAQSASNANVNDASLAKSYSATANGSAYSSEVSSLASSAGLTNSDFTDSVQYQQSTLANGVKSGSVEMNLVSLAQSLVGVVSDGDMTASNEAAFENYNVKSADLNVAAAQSIAAANNNAAVINASSVNAQALTNAVLSSVAASGEAQVAIAYAAPDASTVDSVAKKESNNANDWTSSVASAAFSAAASSVNNNATVTTAKINASLANIKVNNSNVDVNGDTFRVLSDTAALSAASSIKASANSTIASAKAYKATHANAISAASAEVSSANNTVNSAKKAAAIAYGNYEITDLLANNTNSSNPEEAYNFVNGIVNNPAGVKVGIKDAFANNDFPMTNNKNKGGLLAFAKANGYDLADLDNADNVNAFHNLKNDFKNAQTSLNNKGIHGAINASDAASVAVSDAASGYAKDLSASASYAKTNDENVTLASYFASSYSTDASSEAKVASNASNALNNFYLANADAKFASADNAYNNASAADANDSALAGAYGERVYNYAPKYITTQKTFGLYNINGKKYTRLATVPAGVRLAVNGVHIAENGQVRYEVNYKGNKGTVNSYASYVQQTYLPTQDGVTINVVKPSAVYNNVNRNGFTDAIGTVKANTSLNVNIVSTDGVYGGFTAAQILGGKLNGKFISANIAYAAVVGSNNSANTNINNNNTKHYNF